MSSAQALCGLPAATVSPQDPAVAWNTLTGAPPLVIAHRGAAGYRPEHTLPAYRLAIDQGADSIEPDLIMTRDGALIARHEPLLARVRLNPDGTIRRQAEAPEMDFDETSTNVWRLPRYRDRLRVGMVDGVPMGGWFAEDFTLAELRADVRAEERLRNLRPANSAHDGEFPIPTLEEVIDLTLWESATRGRTIGVYPETKHPSYHRRFADTHGLPRMEDTLLRVLHSRYGNRADAPVFIQSFEVTNLQYLRLRTRLPLVQLLAAEGRPQDFTLAGDGRTYADLARPAGLRFLRGFADGIGVPAALLIPRLGERLGPPTRLVADAHRVGLTVHGWTFRAENRYLPLEFRRGTDPSAPGDFEGLLRCFLRLGMDGFFTDQPDLGRAAVSEWARRSARR